MGRQRKFTPWLAGITALVAGFMAGMADSGTARNPQFAQAWTRSDKVAAEGASFEVHRLPVDRDGVVAAPVTA